jgi:HK97 family phage prohead protease
MRTKMVQITEFKALSGENDAPGSFEALVSVFGNIDKASEVIEPGAFKDCLVNRKSFPVVWSHQWTLPPVGLAEVRETDRGLVAKGQLFVSGDDAVDISKHVWTAMRAGALNEWSVGLNVKSERFEERDGRQVTVLEALDLIELGPCLKGVNQETETISVKALQEVAEEAEAPVHEVDDKPAENNQEDNLPTPEQKRAIAELLFQ